ncbi:MAG TPA: hypothetical protein VMJ33_01300 [Gallionella sp.]|nr:hypothetical protein [Gallionella sp.]
MKVVILVFALLVPISIALLVYKTLFSGLRSITTTETPGKPTTDAEEPEQAQNGMPDERKTE